MTTPEYDKIKDIMESPKQQIISNLQKAIKDLTGLELTPQLEHPLEERHGDYSSNIAMAIFSSSKFKVQSSKLRTPTDLAQKIAEKFKVQSSKFKVIEKVEAVKPGFINFWLSKDYLTTLIRRSLIIRAQEKYGKSERLENKKIMVEFAHPNTHKEFHIGHLRNITLGESICRLLEANGADLKRVNYQGDVGLHVAKALYGIMNHESGIKEVEKKSASEKAMFLGKAYAFGSKCYEEDDKAKEEIIDINKKIYSKDPSILSLWQKTRQWSLDYFDLIYNRVGTTFSRLYFESEVYETGKDIVLSHIDDGIFTKSDNAIIFDGEKFGLHKRVFITKEGNTTYEGKEMGLAHLQYKEFPFDQALHIVGPEQAGYFTVVFKVLELIDPVFKNKEKHLSYGFVKLKQGKMSSRMGNVKSGEWLLDEAKGRIREAFKEMDEQTSEQVAVGAVKYSMLKFSRESNIQFSFEDSINLEGNSGPYLQYTYARTQSVLAKTNNVILSEAKNPIKAQRDSSVASLPQNDITTEEISLLRILYRFPEVVEEAADKFAPNLLCNYLFDLCQKFNLFYQKHKIVGSENQEFRLNLTAAVGNIIKYGLNLLGIQALEKM